MPPILTRKNKTIKLLKKKNILCGNNDITLHANEGVEGVQLSYVTRTSKGY